jgi:hypothetical protein
MKVTLSPQDFRELLLSHHPNHRCFDDDVIVISGRRICAGCLFAYPTGLMIFFFLGPTGMTSIIIALLLAAVSQFRRLTKNHTIQNFFRFVAGIALGFGLGGGYWAAINGQWLLVILLISGAGLYGFLKVRSMKRKLENDCPDIC